MESKIVKELTPELANKIYNQIFTKIQNDSISKRAVLHHLKQLKAQFGRLKSKNGINKMHYRNAIDDCMGAIDSKIKKLNN